MSRRCGLPASTALSKEFLHFPSKLAQHRLNTACSKLFQPSALIPPSPPADHIGFFLFLTRVNIHVFSVQKGEKEIGGVEKALTYLTLILEACVDLSPRNSYFLFIYL